MQRSGGRDIPHCLVGRGTQDRNIRFILRKLKVTFVFLPVGQLLDIGSGHFDSVSVPVYQLS